MFSISDDRLGFFMPPIIDVLVPLVREKLQRHGPAGLDMSLVIELFIDVLTPEEVPGVSDALRREGLRCQSVYTVRRSSNREHYDIIRIL